MEISYLQDHYQTVVLGDCCLPPWFLGCRVPQASILSSAQFNVFMKPLHLMIIGLGFFLWASHRLFMGFFFYGLPIGQPLWEQNARLNGI